jgi:phage tail tape-measure protein
VFEEVQSKVRGLEEIDKTFQRQQRIARDTEPVEQQLERAVASMERLNEGVRTLIRQIEDLLIA